MKKKIDVMIVGAQKAGTTSLLRYLGEHPACKSHHQKEFAYFLTPHWYEQDYNNAYEKYFTNLSPKETDLLLAKSATLYMSEEGISHLNSHNPNCKIIFILRNPIDRAYSSYLMEKNAGTVNFEFDNIGEIIERKSGWEYRIFVEFGIYFTQLKTIYKYFSKDQVKVIIYNDLKDDSLLICKEIFTWLKIDNQFKPQTDIKHNTTFKNFSFIYSKTVSHLLKQNNPFRKLISTLIKSRNAYKYGNLLDKVNKSKKTFKSMDSNARIALSNFYKPFNLELSKIIDRDLSSWDYYKEQEI